MDFVRSHLVWAWPHSGSLTEEILVEDSKLHKDIWNCAVSDAFPHLNADYPMPPNFGILCGKIQSMRDKIPYTTRPLCPT
jgi:hypothetical protein